MGNNIDSFLDELQRQIFDDAKQALGEEGFQRWRNPKYCGRMECPDGYACIKGSCGDTMEIFLKFDNDEVTEASYLTNGCASSNVCGSFAVEAAIGKRIDELADISGETILLRLGHLSKEDEHCAYLASETLQGALDSYMKTWVNKQRKE